MNLENIKALVTNIKQNIMDLLLVDDGDEFDRIVAISAALSAITDEYEGLENDVKYYKDQNSRKILEIERLKKELNKN